MQTSAEFTPATVQVMVRGNVPAGTAGYARDKITAAARHIRGPVLDARVRITVQPDPAVPQPIVAKASLDLYGHHIRVQVAAPNVREAVDLLAEKLRSRLERVIGHRQERRSRAPVPGPAGASPANGRPATPPLEAADREVIPRKSFAMPVNTIDEAAFELDAMDYEFYLFTEAGTGQDSVLYRSGPTGLRLAQVTAVAADRLSPFGASVTISDTPAPLLGTDEAIARFELSGLPFLFYLDAEHVHGSVLYRRRDGHYGLITPAR